MRGQVVDVVPELSARIGRLPVTERQYQAALLWREDEAVVRGGGGRKARSPYERQVDDRVDGRRGEAEQERAVEAQARLREITACLGGDGSPFVAMVRCVVIEDESVPAVCARLDLRAHTVADNVRLALTRIGRNVYRLRECA